MSLQKDIRHTMHVERRYTPLYFSQCVSVTHTHREAAMCDDDAAFIVKFHLKANQLSKDVVSDTQ